MRSANVLLRCCFPCSIRTTSPHATGGSSQCHPFSIRTQPLMMANKNGRLCTSSYLLPCLYAIRVEHRNEMTPDHQMTNEPRRLCSSPEIRVLVFCCNLFSVCLFFFLLPHFCCCSAKP